MDGLDMSFQQLLATTAWLNILIFMIPNPPCQFDSDTTPYEFQLNLLGDRLFVWCQYLKISEFILEIIVWAILLHYIRYVRSASRTELIIVSLPAWDSGL